MYHEHKSCIDACLRCSAICDYCASACLKEPHLEMLAHCIQLDLECATICATTAELLSLGSEQAKAFCELCAIACERCAEECSSHEHEHCRKCAEACRVCAEECWKMAA